MDFLNIIGTLFDNSIEHVVALAHQIKDLRLGKNQQDINEDIYKEIQVAKETKDKSKGYYDSYQSLIQNVPIPEIGDWAVVKNSNDDKWYVYKCVVKGYWKETDEEYSHEINLAPYVKKDEFKTVNGQSILGEGDIETGDKYELADQNTDGLLSKDLYSSLLTIKNETLPQIQENIDHILQLFDDEETPENIQEIIDRYNQIAEFIKNLEEEDNGQILYNILNDIEDLKDEFESLDTDIENNIKKEITDIKDDLAGVHDSIDAINNSINDIDEKIGDVEGNIGETLVSLGTRLNSLEQNSASQEGMTLLNNKVTEEISRAQGIENSLDQRISQLEQNPVIPDNITKHIFITQERYDALESYERDTLYLIIESPEGTSHFGDTFPFILG